jgi:hypothetical protein
MLGKLGDINYNNRLLLPEDDSLTPESSGVDDDDDNQDWYGDSDEDGTEASDWTGAGGLVVAKRLASVGDADDQILSNVKIASSPLFRIHPSYSHSRIDTHEDGPDGLSRASSTSSRSGSTRNLISVDRVPSVDRVLSVDRVPSNRSSSGRASLNLSRGPSFERRGSEGSASDRIARSSGASRGVAAERGDETPDSATDTSAQSRSMSPRLDNVASRPRITVVIADSSNDAGASVEPSPKAFKLLPGKSFKGGSPRRSSGTPGSPSPSPKSLRPLSLSAHPSDVAAVKSDSAVAR